MLAQLWAGRAVKQTGGKKKRYLLTGFQFAGEN